MGQREIFTQQTYKQQPNGTVFAAEGSLNDFPYSNLPGEFQSWRYSFDEGKQVFRQENDGKVFEKRMIKDNEGNPKWTNWYEITDAEAHGIQAIAINDLPLQLPNSDGAIKLAITPQSIDTYTKAEINSAISAALTDFDHRLYTYVDWQIDPATGLPAISARRCVEIAYPNGGLDSHYYIVSPQPGISGDLSKTTTFIWADNAWLETTLPDTNIFLTFPLFQDHTDDGILHWADGEKQNWSGYIDEINAAAISGIASGIAYTDQVSGFITEISVLSGFRAHLRDTGTKEQLHVTRSEREEWNKISDLPKIPLDDKRYVMASNDYILAYEQTIQEDNEVTLTAQPLSTILENDQIVFMNLLAQVFNTVPAHASITHIFVTGDIANTMYSPASIFHFENEIGGRSKNYNIQPEAIIWDLGVKPFDRIKIIIEDPKLKVNVSNFKLTAVYRANKNVQVGDPNHTLPLDLIGPENHLSGLLYNGVPLLEKFDVREDWGEISGNIFDQTDLINLTADWLYKKVTAAPGNSSLRYDVFRNFVIPSLIQQVDNGEGLHEFVYDFGDTPHITKNSVIVDNIQSKLDAIRAQGYIPTTAFLKATFVAVYNDGGPDIPVYFETDVDQVLNKSILVGSQPMDLQWPGPIWKDFDKIYLRGNAVEYFHGLKFVIACNAMKDITFEDNQHKYSITVNGFGSGLFFNSTKDEIHDISGNFEVSATNIILKTPDLDNSLRLTENEQILNQEDGSFAQLINGVIKAETSVGTKILHDENESSLEHKDGSKASLKNGVIDIETSVGNKILLDENEASLENKDGSKASLKNGVIDIETSTNNKLHLDENEASFIQKDGSLISVKDGVIDIETSVENKILLDENTISIKTKDGTFFTIIDGEITFKSSDGSYINNKDNNFSITHPDGSFIEIDEDGLNFTGAGGQVLDLVANHFSVDLSDGTTLDIQDGVVTIETSKGTKLTLDENVSSLVHSDGTGISIIDGVLNFASVDGQTLSLERNKFKVKVDESYISIEDDTFEFESDKTSILADNTKVQIITQGDTLGLIAIGENSSGVLRAHNTDLGWEEKTYLDKDDENIVRVYGEEIDERYSFYIEAGCWDD